MCSAESDVSNLFTIFFSISLIHNDIILFYEKKEQVQYIKICWVYWYLYAIPKYYNVVWLGCDFTYLFISLFVTELDTIKIVSKINMLRNKVIIFIY